MSSQYLTLQPVASQELHSWLATNGVRRDKSSGIISFIGEQFTLRIPIDDYTLQLDYRIRAILMLLGTAKLFIIPQNTKARNNSVSVARPLDAVVHLLGINNFDIAYQTDDRDGHYIFALAYLTNRWGNSDDSLFIIPQTTPDAFAYVPGSPESLFVFCRTEARHHRLVSSLRLANIPAYGRHVSNPLPEPIYQDIPLGSEFVQVDPRTGKPTGPGSPESVLLPEYLAPSHNTD